ncbi:hypothetical protein B0T16DRAFT_322459 [Cercophora newfieldiana]|uniref:DNA-directed RNA polymerase subunit n=1 Tax=Cercophora newfieldiana TaxID=92897 RepID=A0AA40CVI2_9PEZI|nr:hypothetical protein B0T16DRAFT_322459 [Cercophora newfieldiana]
MSPAAIDLSGDIIPDSQVSERKPKRDKSEHKKKRAREDDESAIVEETPRKSKKNKSEKIDADITIEQPKLGDSEKKKKKKHRVHGNGDEVSTPSADLKKKSKKDKSHKVEAEVEAPEPEQMEIDQPEDTPIKQSSSKREKKEKKKSKKHRSEDGPTQEEQAHAASDDETKEKKKKRKSKEKRERAASPEPSDNDVSGVMEIDLSTRPKTKGADIFPFYTQTLSLYVPLYPIGFDKPLTNAAAQHLDPLLGHYSPMLKGVLLSYSNLNLSERPVKASASNPSTDDTPALLTSVDEYAVGFGRLTFDAEIFIPARGKWMEGIVQIQNEGHIGVVCWGKFNASIEAKRLPKGWKWVDLTNGDASNGSSSLPSPQWDFEAVDKQGEEDGADGQDLQVTEQMHTTGYWVNERGRKVGGKLRFRIKNFDVGLAGEYGYLSIEGTFLDEEAERALAAEEREMEKRRRSKQNPTGILRPLSRRVPEFSMTKLGKEDEEEDSGQRTVVYKGSRPGTPDD